MTMNQPVGYVHFVNKSSLSPHHIHHDIQPPKKEKEGLDRGQSLFHSAPLQLLIQQPEKFPPQEDNCTYRERLYSVNRKYAWSSDAQTPT